MSIIHFQSTISASTVGYVVTLSGESASDTDASVAYAHITILNDGTVEKQQGAAGQPVQVDAATDWIIPNNKASASFSVRATSISGDPLDGAATETWLSLDTSRTWSHTRASTGTDDTTFTLQISNDGGATILASGSYRITAIVI